MTTALLLITCYLITSLLFFVDFLLEYPHLMPPFLRRRWDDYCFRRTVRRFRRREKLDTAVAVRRKGILRRVPRYTRKIPYLQGHADRRYWRDIGEKLHEIALQYPQKSVEWLPDDEVKENARRLNLAHLGGLVQSPAPKILRQRLRYTWHIPVLQGEQLVAALLAFERGQELLCRDDQDETGDEENETETVTEAVVVPDAKKLEAVREEEEEEDQDSEEDYDLLMETLNDKLVGDEAVDGEAVDNESVGKDEAVEDKGVIKEDEDVEEDEDVDNEAVEEEDVTVLPFKIKKKFHPPKAPLRRSPRLGGAMGSVFIASETGRVVRRSARTMKSHQF